ncbi:hypothetical protein V5O48_010738 [Marasmius crinis-equi]|uniref:F-box domain-containing protein n=1 Tax=Marasmius crinis-equi TaxID=585013 RepID=A0ABR3F7L6_9AGAR
MSEDSKPRLRRSTRGGKRIVAYSEEVEDESDEVFKPSPKKRKKTVNTPVQVDGLGQKSTNRRRYRSLVGATSYLTYKPQIFGYLNPQDLLHLSRTSKDLRSLLFSRSTNSVWKEARSNVEDLPEIPENMSEPAYAHLCFDTQCDLCNNKHPAVNLFWHDRTRSCKGCLDRSRNTWLSLEVERHPRAHDERELASITYHCERDALMNGLWKILRYRGDIVDFDKERDVYEYFICSHTSWQKLLEEWNINKNDSVWIERKMAEGKAIHQHATEMSKWWQRRVLEHEAELNTKRKAREHAILQRLSGLGWKEELDLQRPLNDLEFLKEFRIATQAKKLTEKDWNDLRPKLEEALQKAKEHRLAVELRARWRQRFLKFKDLLQAELDKSPFNTVGPSAFDLAKLPQFQSKLFLPIDHDVTEEDLLDVFTEIPQIRDRWVRAREDDLVTLLRKGGLANVTREMLRYASTIFECDECCSPCVYPRPLVHRCSRYEHSSWPLITQDGAELSFSDFLCATNGKVWDVSHYVFSNSRMMRVRRVLSAMALPANATVEDIRASNVWLENRDSLRRRVLYPAMGAAYNNLAFYLLDWTVLSAEQVAQAVRQSRRPEYSVDCVCVYCQTMLKSSWELAQHLKVRHAVSEWTHRDVIFHMDMPLAALEYEPLRREEPA